MYGLRSLPAGPFRSGGLIFLCFLLWSYPFLFCDENESGETPPAQETPDYGLDTGALRRRISEEASSELLSLNFGDSEVSLFMSGYWKGTLSANWGLSFTPLGTTAASNDSPLLFTQEADLTLSLWIREHWFVEASFMDDYSLNTYRAGYQGSEGEAVQYVGIGNTGLEFPRFPYLDLGGDSPSSFGLYGRFGGGDLTVHSLIRYDAAAREERIFVGDRERTYGYISLQYPLRGLSFVLPDENLDVLPVVYLEDEKGSLRDAGGKRWRIAQASEYAASARYGLVELASEPKGMVAVAYTKGGSAPWNNSLGRYTDPPNPNNFLSVIGDFFNRVYSIALDTYPQPGGGTGTPSAVTIDGIRALVIYEKGTFSPFEGQGRYRSPSSSSSSAALVRLSTGDTVSGYEALPLEDNGLLSGAPLYSSPETQRGIYELIKEGNTGDRRHPESRWPLGEQYPELYLPGKPAFNGDMGIRFTNYGNAGSFSIGTDVVPGSVEVFRGGLSDPHFSFNSSDGIVTLESPPSLNEIIRITYLKRSEERRLGSFAAGVGMVYRPESPFSYELGLGVRWNIMGESFSEEGVASPGTVGVGSKLSWDYENFKANISAGLGFEQTDTTGLYRAAGMEGNEITLSLPAGSSFISEAPSYTAGGTAHDFSYDKRAPLIYRNYQDTNILGASSLMNIENTASVVSGQNRPYPAMDDSLSAQVLTADFEFNPEKTWTGFQVPLGPEADILERAKEIEIPFRFYGFTGDTDNLTVAVQFGALADKDAASYENPNLLVEKVLFPPPQPVPLNPASFNQNARIASFSFTGEERRKLQNVKYMRLLVSTRSNGSLPGTALSGRVLIAPPIVRGAGFRPVIVKNGLIQNVADNAGLKSVAAVETIETGADSLGSQYADVIERLHPAGSRHQRVLELTWKNLESGESAGADGRMNALPLSNYRVLSFFVKGPKGDGADQTELNRAVLRFILARGPSSLNAVNETALDAEIPVSAFIPGRWSKVELRYDGGNREVTVNGAPVSGAILRRNTQAFGQDTWNNRSLGDDGGGKSGYMAVLIIPQGNTLPDGTFGVDEVTLEDSAPVYRLNAGSGLEWKRPGVLVSFNENPVLEDFAVETVLDSALSGDPFTPESEIFAGVVSRSNAETTFLGAHLSGNFSLSASQDQAFWSGGHGFSRSWGPLSTKESFALSPEDKTMNHGLEIALSDPIRSGLSGEAFYEDQKLRRKWDLFLGIRPIKEIPLDFFLEGNADWTENTEEPSQWIVNYGETWVKSWRSLTPDLGSAAVKRDTRGLFKIALETSPLGAELSMDGSSSFSKSNNTTISDTLVRLDFPLRFQDYRMLFRAERRFKRNLGFLGDDIRNDGYKWIESLEDSFPLWYSVPFYSFFDPGQETSMDEVTSHLSSEALYSQFEDKFEFTIRLPGRYDLGALFIPQNFEARINRSMEQKLDTRLDLLNLGTSLGFQSINMFGAFGTLPLFPFYQSDEFTHTIDAAAAIPKDEQASWRIQAEQTMSFYGFTEAELVLANTLTLNSPSPGTDRGNWLDSFKAAWTVPKWNGFLAFIYSQITDLVKSQNSWPALAGLAQSEYEQIRRETLELIIDHSKEYPQFSVILGHEAIIRILGRLNLSAFVKLNCSGNYETEVFSFIGTIGTTLNVTF
jgi:hypothetical protein